MKVAIRYSLFAIRYSLFAIRYSLFAIRYNADRARRGMRGEIQDARQECFPC